MSYTYENGGFMNGDSWVVAQRCQCRRDECVIVPKQWLQQDRLDVHCGIVKEILSWVIWSENGLDYVDLALKLYHSSY